MIKFIGVRLSSNDEKNVEYADGINGQISESSDGRKFFLVDVLDTDNPLNLRGEQNTATIVVWEKNGRFAMTPNDWKKAYVGKEVPGEIFTAEVEPYDIDGQDVTKWTGVRMGNQTRTDVLEARGLTPVEQVATQEPDLAHAADAE